MSVPIVLFLVALVLGLVDVVRTRGQSLTSWGVCALAVGLLWGRVG
jgi:hypothetical protein